MASSPKFKTVFGCQACGFESSKWLGRCPDCGEWNSFVEERQEVPTAASKGRAPSAFTETGAKPKPYDLVDASDTPRIPSGIGEFDRVLGGGIVPGSMVLIGGEPGIGKSTLLLQVAHLLGRQGGAVLYVSGEESERQIKMRGERLGITGAGLFLMAETSLERILEHVDQLKPAALVVDSVQTIYSSRFPSAPGQHQPGARGRDPAPHAGQGARGHHVPHRARDQGRQPWPARSPSSTSWTPSSTSRARSTSTTASCAP